MMEFYAPAQLGLDIQQGCLYMLQPYVLARADQTIFLVMGNMWQIGMWA